MKDATHSPNWGAQLKCIFLLTVILMVWNVHLQIGQHYNYAKIEELMKNQENTIIPPSTLSGEQQKDDLENGRSFGGFENDVHSDNTARDDDGDKAGLLASLFGEKQMSGGMEFNSDKTEHGARMRRSPSCRGERTKSRRRSNSACAHFHSFVDVERLEREKQNNISSTLGEFRELGFMPYERVYRFWKPAYWNHRSELTYFQFNPTSGRLRVMKSGFYLVYAQIMFHTTSARKSFGIYIDHDVTPFVESLSFDAPQYNKAQQHVGRNRGSENWNSSSLHHQRSTEKKTLYHASYSQCSTMAVAHIRRNQEVFLMSGDSTMKTLIVRPAMTFWGIARL